MRKWNPFQMCPLIWDAANAIIKNKKIIRENQKIHFNAQML